jgi:hypothetical protein
MPGHLLDHLAKKESLPLSLWNDSILKWLVLDEFDRLLDRGGFGGQVEQIVQQLRRCCRGPVVGGWCCQGVPERAGVGDGDEQAGVDGKEGAQRG